jgi:hypothetical protein
VAVRWLRTALVELRVGEDRRSVATTGGRLRLQDGRLRVGFERIEHSPQLS